MALRVLYVGVVVLVVSLAAMATARAETENDACWKIIMQALDHSAHAPHARFTSYGQRATITQDGRTLENVRANITYRDDGVAFVDDERWVYPFVSRNLEPGPPVLGPYGDARNMWLGLDERPPTALPIIANVRSHPNISCRDAGVDGIGGLPVHHLHVGDEIRNRLGLRSIWIDPATSEIRRVVVTGPLRIYGHGDWVEQSADFTVDVRHVEGYAVVDRVWWRYEQEIFSQRTIVDAEYDFMDYRFSESPPPGTLPAGTALR
ncbi:MAG: hypothetical protein M3N13_01000 [Candidatus Eremiobacteraeota bacterium]|nr:hypothetical protein [Candidatus Eremiobacteraeota bacterium]